MDETTTVAWYLLNFLTDRIAAGPFDTQAEAHDFDPHDDRLEVRSMDRDVWELL